MNLKEAKALITDRIRIANEYGGLVHLSVEDSQKIMTLLEASGAIVEEIDKGAITPECPPDDDIFDALVTALEGGSNYWYHIPMTTAEIKKQAIQKAAVRATEMGKNWLSILGPDLPTVDYVWFLLQNGTSISIYDAENPEDLLGELSLQGLRNGAIQYISERDPFDPAMDAGEADCFLQYAVLGELVYG